MGRPEPFVLFAQTFVHPQLDEYVDEVIFAEPVVIAACEFLEQNGPSASSAVTLLGATSPPSFALEVFVQCEGETRFRRLCQPFLYSHSSSNVLEVEAVVTNHLVVRGSYRSLSLVIYGNTAEDLGQFSLEFDLDSSLTNLVSSTETKLDDLLPLLNERNQKVEDSTLSLKALQPLLPVSDLSTEIRRFLQLVFKILDLPELGEFVHKVISTVCSVAASFFTHDLLSAGVNMQRFKRVSNDEEARNIIIEASQDLLDHFKEYSDAGSVSAEFLDNNSLEFDADLATSKELVDALFQHFQFKENHPYITHSQLSQGTTTIMWLSSVLLLCSGKEGCFHFVNGGGMKQVACVLGSEKHSSSACTLALLGVIEQATRFSVGCEGFLGWWPREDLTAPSGVSEGYSQLLKLLMHKQRHDFASLATYILHRLRLYEVVSRYECAVLYVMKELAGAKKITKLPSRVFINLRSQLKKTLKMINSSTLVEDPSPVACATRSLLLVQNEGLLSFKATSKLIASSNCCFLNCDMDPNLLSLFKERGLFPLSIALLSSPKLREQVGHSIEVFADIVSSIEATTLLLLFSRSGLVFLLHNPELSSLMRCALNESEVLIRDECIPLRYGYTLISKGFLCRPQEVAVNVEMHLRVVKGIARLITSNLDAEELLCVLWELCALSRTFCGRQALLTIGQFPEVIVVLIEALSSAKESELVALSSGTPLNLAIFHSAAEIFETLVTDPTSSSMGSWIDHAPELHRALHSSSPGSNRKDAPTRLIEWIDAGVVYHKNGALRLLHYTAILASGGDAHITSANVLVSDSMDVENAEGDLCNSPSVNVVENLLGKLVSDKSFEGVALRDSSVAQLTTALRILAFISEKPDVAAVLYDEGGVTVAYVILLNCKLMLERSFNNYDYLVDEGTESNSTSDLLLERNREKCLVDLLIPTLLLLQELFKKLKEAKEQHRNTKLMNALLQLHRELSPKLATSAADLSSTYPEYALALETVCHLITSALAYWPTLAWAPGLFHTLLDTVHVTSLLALGPKEACGLLCLLNDLFPEEDIWLWKDGMPLFTALRSVAVGSILGPYKERQVNWYLDSVHVEQLISQLAPHINKIAQVLLQYAVSTLSVIQDMIRVFVIRIACQRAELAGMLVRPIISWILDHMPESHSVADIDTYKVYKLLNLLSGLLEHPLAKPLLMKEGAVRMLIKVLQWCSYAHGNQNPAVGSFTKSKFNLFYCCLPVLKSIALICDSGSAVQCPGSSDRQCHLTAEDSTMIFRHLFMLCQSLPVEREISACLGAFRELASCAEGQSALLEISLHIKSNGVDDDQLVGADETHGSSSLSDAEWGKHPLMSCWVKLYGSVEKDGLSKYSVEALHALCLGALGFCIGGKSLDEDRVAALKCLFGLFHDVSGANSDQEHMNSIQYVEDMPTLLQSMVTGLEDMRTKTMLEQVFKASRFLLLLMQEQTVVTKADDSISVAVNLLTSRVPPPSRLQAFRDNSSRKSQSDLYFVESGEEFQWECPENLRNRLSQAGVPGKRKMPSSDGLSRHGRADNPPSEAQSMFSRGSGLSAPPSGPTRRDTFRQRKPNTSRPPSMHVDDYVARERNADGTVNSNVIAIQRIGSSSGRPPSIHVDEFVARQRDRQNTVAMAGSETVSQGKAAPPPSETKAEKSNKPKQLKVDLDDDLQGIDIVFDVEESEHDDKLPFPQPDDAAQQAASTTAEQSPQRSIVEETESDMNDLGTRVASNPEENTQSGLSSRISVSQSATPLTREPSISSEKKYLEPGTTAAPSNTDLAAAAHGLVNDSRMIPPAFYPHNNSMPTGNSPAVKPLGHHESKFLPNQPPLPPTPPPHTISPLRSMVPDPVRGPSSPFINSMADVQSLLPPTYHVQTEHQPAYNNIPTSLASSNPMIDTRYPRTAHSSPGGPSRPLPPLPSTPPPFPAAPFTIPLRNSNQSSFGKQSGMGPSEVLQPPIASTDDGQLGNIMPSGSRHTYPSGPNATFSRPSSVLSTMHGSIPAQQQFDSLPNISPSNPAQSMQPLVQLQPLQPPQLPFTPQPPHQLRPTVQGLQQSDQSGFQAPGQVLTQSHTMLQQSHVQQQYQLYHQQQRQENYSHIPHVHQMDHAQVQAAHQQRDGAPQAQQDSAMTLQQYFSSPEAIQSLLSDRDKLCQLLEQHPKLMQMLQERLGQL